ncbi:hypothetical protein NAT65_25365 [Achromobacter xylosoxidans]|uniref:hypothetical protein n=1 Tax=Alcaligenes xylosoxydans xylosoxydans TaxID=85698 RepID=UPI00203D8884|nr:hypothetical protein [Achromobacter xylosoxidans]MCM2574433.1 hypothetical protein [Achromobacter xylosoxidans]
MIKRKTGAFLAWRAALAAMCAVAGLLGPAGHALGQEVTSGCQFNRNPSQGFDPTRTGADSYLTTFTPLQINLDKTIPVGEVVYETSLPVIPWVCITNIPDRLPYMGSGGYMQTMIKDLASAGLKLVLQINNYPEWTPSSSTTDNRLVLSDVTYAAKSPSDPTMTASGILHGKLKLVMVTPPNKPTRTYIPAMGNLVVLSSGVSTLNVISIGSNSSTTIALIPKCIAKISTPGPINLGKAYAVNHLPLPPPVDFTITADYDESCDGGFRIVDLGNLVVPLQLRFQPEGNQELTPGNQEILLKNNDGTPNGFALGINELSVHPVIFNQWQDSHQPSLTTSKRPLPLRYSAQLTKSGTPLITGEFSQQVTVQVTFR